MHTIGSHIAPLRPDDTGDMAYARFDADPNCLLLAVVDEDQRPVGLLERNHFLTQLAGHYGRSIYGNRPISLLMDRNPLIVDASVRAGDFSEMALEQFSEKLLKGFIVVQDGRYFGVGAIIDLLKSAISERTRAASRLEQLVHFDALTGLANRARLHERLSELLAPPEAVPTAADAEIALLAIDLDRFKLVNDTFGHDAGDKVLREVAARLAAVLRPADLAARLGGDEFAIVLRCADAADTAPRVAERVAKCLKEPFVLDDKVMFLGGSVGIAVWPQDARDPGELLKFADMALYCAKTECKGGWRRFNRSMLAGLEQRGVLEADLRAALARDQLEVYLQPILDIGTDTISGYEALMRWKHPEHGYIPPTTFIRMAEDLGLIGQMGEWMIRQACALLRQLPAPLTVSVNVSSVQFRLPGLVAAVAQALARGAVAPERLVLEITESVLIGDEEQVLHSIRQLRALGVRIALDDFGTGFASFAYLQRFSFDRIKIDQSFTNGLPHSPESRAIISAVSVLASQLGMTVTVEGVETEAQLAAVRHLGCQEAQGFLIGRPQPSGTVVEAAPTTISDAA